MPDLPVILITAISMPFFYLLMSYIFYLEFRLIEADPRDFVVVRLNLYANLHFARVARLDSVMPQSIMARQSLKMFKVLQYVLERNGVHIKNSIILSKAEVQRYERRCAGTPKEATSTMIQELLSCFATSSDSLFQAERDRLLRGLILQILWHMMATGLFIFVGVDYGSTFRLLLILIISGSICAMIGGLLSLITYSIIFLTVDNKKGLHRLAVELGQATETWLKSVPAQST